MPKVSVIMPCLNMVKYIRECLDSVISQTLLDIEILIIDAGSTDGTLEILDTYVERDSRIRIIHSDKKSYGYQVNLGVAKASGIYIGIVDTDDKIASDMYEELYMKAFETKADYVKGTAKGFYTLTDEDSYYFTIAPYGLEEYDEQGIEISPKDTPEILGKDRFLWYGLYKASFLKSIKLHESPGAAFQDLGALVQIQTKAVKAVYIDKLVYYYRQDNTDSSNYNQNGIHFIEDEYRYAERFLEGLSLEWHSVYYRKQFYHFADRIHAMAVGGMFWEDALPDMLALSEKLKQAYESGFLTKSILPEEHWQDLQLLWESPRFLYHKYRDIYEREINSLKMIIQHLKGDCGVIFGCGNLGSFVHAQLLYRGEKSILAYCDNSKGTQKTMQYGVEVLKPEQAVCKYPFAKYIVANKRHAEEMKEQLKNIGIEEQKIMIYSGGTNYRLFGAKLN